MNRKIKLGLLMVSFAFLMSSVYTASGAVIQKVIMTGDFGLDGLPVGDQFVFIPQADDAVYVYFNMTEVYAGDTILFKYIQPSGAVYHFDEWVAYDWLSGETYNTFSEIEVQASPAADLPGMWSLEIYNEDTVDENPVRDSKRWLIIGNDDDTSNTIIRGYYIFVKDVKIVGEVVLGQNVTVEMTIEYNYPILSPLVPSIFNEDFEPIADTSDEIQGAGETTYTLSMRTSPGDDAKTFYAVAYFYVDGNWTFMESGGYMPFTISTDGSGSSIIPDNFELPDIDIGQITSTLNQTFQQGLDLLKNIEIPDEVAQIEEEIKERTGIPGFPVEALLMGAAAVGLALRKRD